MSDKTIAYFSMGIAIEPGVPAYSGGLGLLGGDTIRSAANFNVPMGSVILLHRRGYCYQRLNTSGRQFEDPVEWVVDDFLQEMPPRPSVTIGGRSVHLRA